MDCENGTAWPEGKSQKGHISEYMVDAALAKEGFDYDVDSSEYSTAAEAAFCQAAVNVAGQMLPDDGKYALDTVVVFLRASGVMRDGYFLWCHSDILPIYY